MSKSKGEDNRNMTVSQFIRSVPQAKHIEGLLVALYSKKIQSCEAWKRDAISLITRKLT
jgi:hypothetical protein